MNVNWNKVFVIYIIISFLSGLLFFVHPVFILLPILMMMSPVIGYGLIVTIKEMITLWNTNSHEELEAKEAEEHYLEEEEGV